MASILTNASAMTALQTLAQTNKNLNVTPNRIATGMRAQNGALGAVKDSMGFGAAVVDTAYTALNEAISKTEDIFKKYVSLEQGGVDANAVNAEIDQLKAQVTAIAKNADFEGQNLLKTGGSDLTVVTGYIKGGASSPAPVQPTLVLDNTDAVAAAAADALAVTVDGLDTTDLAANQSFTFTVGTKTYSVNAGSSGMNNATLIGNIQSKLADDGIAATWDGTTLSLAKTATASGESIAFSGGEIVEASGGIQTMDVEAFDLETQIGTVSDAASAEAALGAMRAAAAKMGAAKMRIDSQVDFTSKLMDAVDRGIGVLVDADMNAGALRIDFEDPPDRFVVSPNAPVRQIWVSAHVQSFKLDWQPDRHAFVLPATGESLEDLIANAIRKHIPGFSF